MLVRIEHLFGRVKARWQFMQTCSRLKTGDKNVVFLEGIFILNNILNHLEDNSPVADYYDPEDDNLTPVAVAVDDAVEDANEPNDTELNKGKKRRDEILKALKDSNKLY